MTNASPATVPMNRRQFCTAATTVAVGAGVASTPRAAGRPTPTDGLDGWFDDVSNYDGVVDATGRPEVRVQVGVATAAGPFGFGPAAVRVDPGTTVIWEWTGAGGVHDVSATDGSFRSDLLGEPGATFEHAFEIEGVYRYVCTPHEPLGMKGAVVVGDVEVGGGAAGAAGGEPDYGDWFEDVANYEGTVDARDRPDVDVQVGATVDGVPFAFEPAAVRVSPGTTVTWEWTGEGGAHDVVHEAGDFESDLVAEAGHTFSHTFDSPGIYRYACTPHEQLGMKGAVVVGDFGADAGAGTAPGRLETLATGSLLVAVLSALFLVPLSELRKGGRRQAG